MRDWISDLLIFSAGITGGVLVTMIKPILSAAKRRRTELVAARTRILADMKEQHDKEILHEAFRATEAIRGELDKTRETLRKRRAGAQPSNSIRKSSSCALRV